MPIRLGKYRVDWAYDPAKHITYCTIHNSENELIAESNAQLAYRAHYDKVRVRAVTFKAALKEITKKGLLQEEEVKLLRERFIKIPNKGVI